MHYMPTDIHFGFRANIPKARPIRRHGPRLHQFKPQTTEESVFVTEEADEESAQQGVAADHYVLSPDRKFMFFSNGFEPVRILQSDVQ